MADNVEKRMAGDFEIIHSMRIGDREIVLGENPAGIGDEDIFLTDQGDILCAALILQRHGNNTC